MNPPDINAIPDLTLLTTKLLQFIEFEEKDEIQKLKEESDARLKTVIKMPEKPDMPANLRDFMGIDDDEDEIPIDSFRIL